jgi:putative restriction endonuclease
MNYFEDWMRRRGLSESTISKYEGAINGVLTQWANDDSLTSKSLSSITDSNEFSKIIKAIQQLPVFKQRNTTGHTMYSNALARYDEFLKESQPKTIEDDIDSIVRSPNLSPTEKTALISARIGQGGFRTKLIQYWKGCSATRFSDAKMLIASHIKPWHMSDNAERLDVYNGFLFLPNLDRAFELGYISFTDDGTIIISPALKDRKSIGVDQSLRIKVAPEHMKYLDYHRTWKFKKT